MMKLLLRLFASVLVLSAIVACLDDSITGVRDLGITLTADKTTTTTGDPVVFTFDATGNALAGVLIDFGDGAVDTTQLFGSIEAGGTTSHAFDSVGTYTVQGEAISIEGTITDEVVISVN